MEKSLIGKYDEVYSDKANSDKASSVLIKYREYQDMNDACRLYVMSDTNANNKTITRLQAFVSWLEKETGSCFNVQWPEKPFDDVLGRSFIVLKELQNTKMMRRKRTSVNPNKPDY